MNFIGVDVHKDILTVANINEKLDIEFIRNIDTEEFINYLKNRKILIIAIDAPYKLNLGLMNDAEYRRNLNKKLNGHYNKKVSEYELSRRGINPFSTPGSIDEIKGWKSWMNTGFNLYSRLHELGYREIGRDLTKNINGNFIEVFPHACFTVLLGYIPSKKHTAEGLRERIGILQTLGFNNLEELLCGCGNHEKTDRLDALVAAYTAYLAHSDNVIFVGDHNEGRIAVPTTILNDSYKRKNQLISSQFTSTVSIPNESNKFNVLYEYINADSVLWLKYFRPVNSSPPIKDIIRENLNDKIKVCITNEEDKSIIVELVPLINRADGLKVSKEYKSKLYKFWGSHGDKRKYYIAII